MKKYFLLIFVSACIEQNTVDLPDINKWEEMNGVMSNHYTYYRTGDGNLTELLDRHFGYTDKNNNFHEMRVHYNSEGEEWFVFYTLRRIPRSDFSIYIFEKENSEWVFLRELDIKEVKNFYRNYIGFFPLDWELEEERQ